MAGGFDSLGLMPELLRSVHDLGWLLPTDVQDESIPLILGGGDVMVAAETGSGKTAAFVLPIIQTVHERLRACDAATTNEDRPMPTKRRAVAIRLNPNDQDVALQVDPTGLHCSSSSPAWCGARATHGVSAGQYFFECTIRGGGICRLGFSSMAAHLELGKDSYGFGYGGKGFLSTNGSFDKYGEQYYEGDTVSCFIDFKRRLIGYSKNGTYLGKAFDIPEHMLGAVLFPAVLIQNSALELNFGDVPFKYPPSASLGYKGLNQADPSHIFDANAKEVFVVAGKRRPLALIVEPTRDLAEQVAQSVWDLTKYVFAPELCSVLVIGDDRGGKVEAKMRKGVDIVVGTIGKLSSMLKSGSLDLSCLRFFVLDEADKLLSPDNLASVMQIYAACPGGGTGENRLQVCFFSATLHSPQIRDLAARICVNPTWVDLKGFESVPETVHHTMLRVDPDSEVVQALLGGTSLAAVKPAAVTDQVHIGEELSSRSQRLKECKQHLLKRIIDKFDMSQCLVFCRTNLDCTNLETYFNSFNGGRQFTGKVESGKESLYSCCVLAGMRSMEERRTNLQAFKDGDTRILICTDVAARGIDISGLPYVVNLTLPDESEDYIHRVGRVGRADRMGLAISLVAADDIKEKVWFHTCSNRGKGCTNRELKEKKGCTIWYDEAQLLARVEKRLHQEIAQLQPDLSLPPELAALNIIYGEDLKKEDPAATAAAATFSSHIAALGPAVHELAVMEIEAQNIFLSMRT